MIKIKDKFLKILGNINPVCVSIDYTIVKEHNNFKEPVNLKTFRLPYKYTKEEYLKFLNDINIIYDKSNGNMLNIYILFEDINKKTFNKIIYET